MNRKRTPWAFVLVLIISFYQPLLVGGSEWVFTDPPVTQNPDGSYVRNPAASIRGDWKQSRVLHGSPTPAGLPNQLPGMGSREAMLNYIVGSNNMAMNVHIGLVIEEPASEYFSLRTGRWSDGYRSYSEALTDIGTGFALTWAKFRTNNLPNSLVYATITVTYFNDHLVGQDRGNGLALQVYNPVDILERVTLEKILQSIEIEDPIDYGQVILSVPRLTSINMKVEVQPGLIAELDWTAATGAKPSSLWRTLSAREWTTATYLYLRNWYADGSKPGRFTLRSQAGQVITYTQYGDDLGDVRLQMLHGAKVIKVMRPRGATVELSSSPDLRNWTHQIGVQVGSEPTTVNVAQPLSIMYFFRGEAF